MNPRYEASRAPGTRAAGLVFEGGRFSAARMRAPAQSGLESRRLLAPEKHSGVLLETEHAIEFWIVENVPEAINRSARAFRLLRENVIYSSKHEAQRCVIALLHSFLDGRYGDDRAETRDRVVIRQAVGRRQIRRKDAL